MSRTFKGEQTVIEAMGGSKEAAPFFRSLTTEEWIAWGTALLMRDNPSSGLSPTEWITLVRRMHHEGKLT